MWWIALAVVLVALVLLVTSVYVTAGRIRPLRRLSVPFLRIPAEHADDVVDSADDPAREIAGAKARHDRVLDDQARDCVRQRAFDAVADLDAYFAFVRCNDQQGAVIFAFLADLPLPSELHAIIFDGSALQGFQRDHDELVARLRLEVSELLCQRRARGGVEDARVVHHAPSERRKRERHRGECEKKEKNSSPDERSDIRD